MMPDKALEASINGLNQYFKVDKTNSQIEIIVDSRAKAEGVGSPLLAKVNVDHLINFINNNGVEFPGGMLSLPEVANLWAEAYGKDQIIEPSIGVQCAKCEFRTEIGNDLKSGFHECWKLSNGWEDKDFEGGTVLDLWNFRGKNEAIRRGARRLSQITQDDIKYKDGDDGLSNTERQWMQIAGISKEHDKGGFYLDTNYMTAEMNTWIFPYHFIDFETATIALPFFKGMHPYEQLAFQFSHHTMSESGDVHHVDQFLLVEPGQFPNFEFARALKASLHVDDGSVFMWSNHENMVLEKIIQQLEKEANPPTDKDGLVAFLKTLTKGGERAMIDLKILAQKTYFHPDTKASSSIKKVLPAVLKTSNLLRKKYSQPIYGAAEGIRSFNFKDFVWWKQRLGGAVVNPYEFLKGNASALLGDEADEYLEAEKIGIAEGGAAAAAYSRLQFESLDLASREQIKSALLCYCELDTLAMVMIVEAWKESCL